MDIVLEELILVGVQAGNPAAVMWSTASAGVMLCCGALRRRAGKEKSILDNYQLHDHDKGLTQTWFPRLLTASQLHDTVNPILILSACTSGGEVTSVFVL